MDLQGIELAKYVVGTLHPGIRYAASEALRIFSDRSSDHATYATHSVVASWRSHSRVAYHECSLCWSSTCRLVGVE